MISQETKILIGIAIGTILVLFGGIFFINRTQSPTPTTQNTNGTKVISTDVLVKPSSHQIATQSAKVTLVEFGDFQCPACGVAYPVARKIKEEYAGRINFVFRHYPLQGHLNAFNAAMAAESAANQGKFWEMHDKLYEKQKEWSDSDKWLDIFIKYAKDLGLDIEKFKTDMNDTRLGERIRADQTDGNAAGLTATPTFYLNGEMLVGVPDYGKLKEKIDKLL